MMSGKTFSSELDRTLARPDIDDVRRVLKVYNEWELAENKQEYYKEHDEVETFMGAFNIDPEFGLALVTLAAATYDDSAFLGLVSAGLLEDLLREATPEMADRMFDEARKSRRFQWMLSVVYPQAIECDATRKRLFDAVGTVCGDDPLPELPWAQ